MQVNNIHSFICCKVHVAANTVTALVFHTPLLKTCLTTHHVAFSIPFPSCVSGCCHQPFHGGGSTSRQGLTLRQDGASWTTALLCCRILSTSLKWWHQRHSILCTLHEGWRFLCWGWGRGCGAPSLCSFYTVRSTEMQCGQISYFLSRPQASHCCFMDGQKADVDTSVLLPPPGWQLFTAQVP